MEEYIQHAIMFQFFSHSQLVICLASAEVLRLERLFLCLKYYDFFETSELSYISFYAVIIIHKLYRKSYEAPVFNFNNKVSIFVQYLICLWVDDIESC